MDSSWFAGVETMSGSLRYRNEVICDHLASQYVAGAMTFRVRARMESLLTTTPELDRAVAFWGDQFSTLHEQLPAEVPGNKTWEQIDKKISILEADAGKEPVSGSWWHSLLLWRVTGVGGMVMSCVLAMFLLLPSMSPSPQVTGGANYVATMSAHNIDNAEIQFVISAYKKQGDIPSRLHVQWSQEHISKKGERPLHLWAEDKDSGEMVYIGLQPPQEQGWDLNKPSWLAVANSSRLLMTSNSNVPDALNTIFSGPCVQLTAWKS